MTLGGGLCLDVALRYETLGRDLAAFARQVDLDPTSVALAETKVGRHLRQGRPVADYFDQDGIDTVQRRMAWVFSGFDYPTTPSKEPN